MVDGEKDIWLGWVSSNDFNDFGQRERGNCRGSDGRNMDKGKLI